MPVLSWSFLAIWDPHSRQKGLLASLPTIESIGFGSLFLSSFRNRGLVVKEGGDEVAYFIVVHG